MLLIFIDGSHIKAGANKKKFQKKQAAKAAKVYTEQLLREINEEREKLGKEPVDEDDDDSHGGRTAVWPELHDGSGSNMLP